MIHYSKMLGLFGIAAIVPLTLSTAANAQLQLERAEIELTPNCEVIDCGWMPRELPPRIVIPDACDPRFCDPIEFEVERIELERLSKPVLEGTIRQGELQNAGRLQSVKFDEDYYRPEPIKPEFAYGNDAQKPQHTGSLLKFDE